MCNHEDSGETGSAGREARWVDVSQWSKRDIVRGLAAGSLALLAPGCVTNPETGQSQLILIDDAQLQQMALQAWAQQAQETPVWNNRAAQQRLERVGMRIAQGAGRGNESWEFRLFDTPDMNAFVLPGNKVGFYRGLYEMSEIDDWMATVLGHEVGHVTGRHAAERVSREYATQAALSAAGTQVESQAIMAALGLGAQVGLSLPFTRSQESQADILGLNYMQAAGYDVKQAIPFWRAMSSGGGSRPPEFLSTHPAPATRIAEIANYINSRGWGPV